MNSGTRDISLPEKWDRRGLPAWSYHSDAFLELEKDHVFRTHWLIACHSSDVPEPGDYFTFDAVGERAIIIRGDNGELRAFHNICRHRGSRLVADEKGTCKNAMICPFHGWVYNLDGTLRGAARPKSFPTMDKTEFGLIPMDIEVWMGFVYIRFHKGPQPSVAEMMKPFEEEAAAYKMDTLVPTNGVTTMTTAVNWKSVRDVDNEGYHVPMAHPALQDLYGSTYYDEPWVNGTCRSFGTFKPHGGRLWSVRNYLKFSTPAPHLPEHLHRAWGYYGLFPSNVIIFMPESIQFYNEYPISKDNTLLRGGIYRYPNEDRNRSAARYLIDRIDRTTIDEDVQLTIWSNEAMASKSFAGFYLSDLEYGVRTYHDQLREVLPVLTLETPPGEDRIADINAEMLAARAESSQQAAE
jgi:phenylpropionate dioxygenase-like ring-hydroxylating dioxygenase large terminal subunit